MIGNVVVVVPVIVPAQLSVAVGAIGALTVHSSVRSARLTMSGTGETASVTSTVCVWVVVLPLESS